MSLAATNPTHEPEGGMVSSEGVDEDGVLVQNSAAGQTPRQGRPSPSDSVRPRMPAAEPVMHAAIPRTHGGRSLRAHQVSRFSLHLHNSRLANLASRHPSSDLQSKPPGMGEY